MGTIPPSISQNLTPLLRQELGRLDLPHQEQFIEDFRRRRKSTGLGYICWLFGLHYAYLGKWALQLLFWFTLAGLFIWWIIDAFRLPHLIHNENQDLSADILRNIRAIG